MTSEKSTVVDLEARLAADASGAYRDELVRTLAAERSTIKKQIDAGLPPAEYEQANKLLAGVDAATKVVQTLWKTVH
ncbi:MAG TPA: EscE/YscE/SsaE family type III secretion system needle protein co-chaperone [Caulifigura sp.]|nr:EscE/YscE/SsaE family type III secretion system needle protein co-chaperone [Caulifigura sp.]